MTKGRWRIFVIQNSMTSLTTAKLVDEGNTTEDILAELTDIFRKIATTQGIDEVYIDGLLYSSPAYIQQEKRYLKNLEKCK